MHSVLGLDVHAIKLKMKRTSLLIHLIQERYCPGLIPTEELVSFFIATACTRYLVYEFTGEP
jgi:hypothetical protein